MIVHNDEVGLPLQGGAGLGVVAVGGISEGLDGRGPGHPVGGGGEPDLLSGGALHQALSGAVHDRPVPTSPVGHRGVGDVGQPRRVVVGVDDRGGDRGGVVDGAGQGGSGVDGVVGLCGHRQGLGHQLGLGEVGAVPGRAEREGVSTADVGLERGEVGPGVAERRELVPHDSQGVGYVLCLLGLTQRVGAEADPRAGVDGAGAARASGQGVADQSGVPEQLPAVGSLDIEPAGCPAAEVSGRGHGVGSVDLGAVSHRDGGLRQCQAVGGRRHGGVVGVPPELVQLHEYRGPVVFHQGVSDLVRVVETGGVEVVTPGAVVVGDVGVVANGVEVRHSEVENGPQPLVGGVGLGIGRPGLTAQSGQPAHHDPVTGRRLSQLG